MQLQSTQRTEQVQGTINSSYNTSKNNHKNPFSKMVTLFGLASLLVSAVMGQTTGPAPIVSSQMTVSPNTVGMSSTVTFNLALQTSQIFSTSDSIMVSVPYPLSFVTSTLSTNCASLTTGITISSCIINSSNVTLKMNSTVQSSKLSFSVKGFTNPVTDAPVSYISAQVSDSMGNVKASEKNITLNGIVAAQMATASIKPLVDQIGAFGVSAQISFSIKTVFKNTGLIRVQFPPWNPADLYPQDYIYSPYPACKGVAGVSLQASCYYDNSTRTLTLKNVVDADAPANTVLTFTVDSFRNPYNGKTISGFIISASSTGDYGNTDTFNATLQVLTPAPWSQAYLGREDGNTTVSEISALAFGGMLDLPVDQFCRLEVTFPADMPIGDTIKQYTAQGFINQTKANITSVNAATNSFYIDGCGSYSPTYSSYVGLVIYYVRNKAYVQQTGNFTFKLSALTGANGVASTIASASLPLTADQFTPGQINSFYIRPVDSNVTGQFTRYALSVLPQHSMTASSVLSIKFPQSINLTQGACSIANFSTPLASTAKCSVTANEVILSSMFVTTTTTASGTNLYTPATSGPLNFVFSSGGFNPIDAMDIGAFNVSVFVQNTMGQFIVDSFVFKLGNFSNQSSTLTPTPPSPPYSSTNNTSGTNTTTNTTYPAPPAPAPPSPYNYTTNTTTNTTKPLNSTQPQVPLNVTILSGSSYEIFFSPASYVFMLYPNKSIPINSTITIELPREMDLAGGNNPNVTVYLGNSYDQWMPNITKVISRTPSVVLRVMDAFAQKGFEPTDEPIYLAILGLRNPRSYNLTTSFKISLNDSKGAFLESAGQNMSVQMYMQANIPEYNVTTTSKVVNASTNLTFSIRNQIPLMMGDFMQIDIPEDVTLADKISCQVPPKIGYTINCTKWVTEWFQIVNVTFKGTNTTATTNLTLIQQGSVLSFNLTGVRNPPSTRPSAYFKNLVHYDNTGAGIAYFQSYRSDEYNNYTVVAPQIQATEPVTVQKREFTSSTMALGEMAMYTISYTTAARLPNGATFQVQFPSYTSEISWALNCSVSISYYEGPYPMDCYMQNNTLSIIGDAVYREVFAGEIISLTFGPIQNPSSQKQNESLRLFSFTDYYQQDRVEQVLNGLSPVFECDYPCGMCKSSNKSACTSCIKGDVNGYFWNSKCLPACPNGTFSDEQLQCQSCPDGCATCTGYQQCTSCRKGSFLWDSYCYQSCPSDLCSIKGVCSQCPTEVSSFAGVNYTLQSTTVGSQTNLTVSVRLANNMTLSQDDMFIINLGGYASAFGNKTQNVRTNTTGVKIANFTFTAWNQLVVRFNVTSTTTTTTTSQGVRQFLLDISGFINPSVMQDVPTFIQLFDKESTLKAQSNNFSITGFVPNKLKSVALKPYDYHVNAQGPLVIRFQTSVSINAYSGMLKLNLPVWYESPFYGTFRYFLDTKPACQNLDEMNNTNITCQFEEETNVLTISYYSQTDLPAGSVIQISVDSFRNTYTSGPKMGFQLSSYVVSTTAEEYTLVEQSEVLSMALSDGAIELPEDVTFVNRVNGSSTVGENSTVRFWFYWNIPVDNSCILRIYFPEDMPTTSGIQLAGDYSGMFANSPKLITVNNTKRFVEVQACNQYEFQVNDPHYITLQNVVNKGSVSPTGNFTFEFYNTGANGTRYLTWRSTGIAIKAEEFTPGTVNSFAVQAIDSNSLGAKTRYAFKIKPQHSIPPKGRVHIQFPYDITLSQTDEYNPCNIFNASKTLNNKTRCYVELTTNEIILENLFDFNNSKGYQRGQEAISFAVNVFGKNPVHHCSNFEQEDNITVQIPVFTVNTFAVGPYGELSIIDTYDFSTLTADQDHNFTGLALSPPSINITVWAQNQIASAKNEELLFVIQSDNEIPQGSSIIFTFPDEVKLVQDYDPTNLTCFVSYDKDIFYPAELEMIQQIPLQFQVSGVLEDGSMYPGQSIFISCKGVFTNPPVLGPSENSFQVQVIGPQGCAVSNNTRDILLTMNEVPSVEVFMVSPQNATNGAITSYSVMIDTFPYVLQAGDSILMRFPSETVLPINGSCTLISQSAANISCSTPARNVLRVRLAQAQDQVHQFTVNKVRNPNSTRTSSPFTMVQIVNKRDRVVSTYPLDDVTVKNTQPANATGTLVQANKNLNSSTELTITYIPSNPLPAGASFALYFPAELGMILPQDLRVCEITIGQNTTKNVMLCKSDPFRLSVYIYEGLNVNVSVGTKVNIKIGNITNAEVQPAGPLPSVQFWSFTDRSQTDTIDQILSGLVPTSQCDYPCATCSANSRSTCTSCIINKDSVLEKYLSAGKCVAQCPDGTWNNNFTCTKCPSDCKTCASDKVCLTCDTSSRSKAKFMNNSRCSASCNKDSFTERGSFFCQKCDSNCASCNFLSNNCTACPADAPNLFPTIENNVTTSTCVSKCADKQIVVKGVCTTCKTPCDTCVVSADQCLACTNGFLVGTKCYQSCPSGFTTNQLDKKCVGCDPNCKKCDTVDKTKCLQCNRMVLLGNTCVTSCPYGMKSDGIKCV